MFEEKTRMLIEDKYVEMVCTVIDELRAYPMQNIQNSIKLPANNLWEAFMEHMQHEEEDFHASNHVAILDVCQRAVQSLTITELKLLWLVSEGASIWEEDNFPDMPRMLNNVVEELMSWVEQEAEDPELEINAYEDEYDDDDEEDIEIYPKDTTRH